MVILFSRIRCMTYRRDSIAEGGGTNRQLRNRDAERAHRVVHSTEDGCGRAEIAGFARSLLAEYGERRRRAMVDDLDLGHFMRGGQQIIHEGLRDHLPLLVVDELFEQGGSYAMSYTAERHSPDDVRIDHRAAVVANYVTAKLGKAEVGIDRNQHHMKLE